MARLAAWLRQLCIAIDQIGLVIIAGPFFVAGLGKCPSARETISARVGQSAEAGHRWALIAEWLIDRFYALTGLAPLGHCRRAFAAERLGCPIVFQVQGD